MHRTLATILREGRARYETAPSHAPYRSEVEGGHVCAAMAVQVNDDGGAERLLCEAAGVEGADQRRALIEWNASHSTDDVLAAFDRAILAAEA